MAKCYANYTIAKVNDGTNGTNGQDAYNIIVSNDNIVFTADANGNVTASQFGQVASVSIYKGEALEPISSWTLSAVFSPTNNIAGSIDANGAITISTFVATADIGYVTITATKGAVTLTKVIRATKSKQGQAGQNGQNGQNAVVYSIRTDVEVIRQTEKNGEMITTSFTVSGYKTVGNNPPENISSNLKIYGTSNDDLTDWVPGKNVTATSTSYVPSSQRVAYKIDMYVDDVLVATKNLPYVYDGAQGEQGPPGQDITLDYTPNFMRTSRGVVKTAQTVTVNVIKPDGVTATPTFTANTTEVTKVQNGDSCTFTVPVNTTFDSFGITIAVEGFKSKTITITAINQGEPSPIYLNSFGISQKVENGINATPLGYLYKGDHVFCLKDNSTDQYAVYWWDDSVTPAFWNNNILAADNYAQIMGNANVDVLSKPGTADQIAAYQAYFGAMAALKAVIDKISTKNIELKGDGIIRSEGYEKGFINTKDVAGFFMEGSTGYAEFQNLKTKTFQSSNASIDGTLVTQDSLGLVFRTTKQVQGDTFTDSNERVAIVRNGDLFFDWYVQNIGVTFNNVNYDLDNNIIIDSGEFYSEYETNPIQFTLTSLSPIFPSGTTRIRNYVLWKYSYLKATVGKYTVSYTYTINQPLHLFVNVGDASVKITHNGTVLLNSSIGHRSNVYYITSGSITFDLTYTVGGTTGGTAGPSQYCEYYFCYPHSVNQFKYIIPVRGDFENNNYFLESQIASVDESIEPDYSKDSYSIVDLSQNIQYSIRINGTQTISITDAFFKQYYPVDINLTDGLQQLSTSNSFYKYISGSSVTTASDLTELRITTELRPYGERKYFGLYTETYTSEEHTDTYIGIEAIKYTGLTKYYARFSANVGNSLKYSRDTPVTDIYKFQLLSQTRGVETCDLLPADSGETNIGLENKKFNVGWFNKVWGAVAN